MKKPKRYRFFYHYYKQYNEMSVHFKNTCYRVKEVKCEVPCETHWNKTQPHLIMRGFCSNVSIDNNIAIIS